MIAVRELVMIMNKYIPVTLKESLIFPATFSKTRRMRLKDSYTRLYGSGGAMKILEAA
jgi:hypothetical protein